MKILFRCWLLAVVVPILMLQGCSKSTHLNTQAPTDGVAAAPTFEPKLSTINVPVSFKINTLQEKLNKEFAGVLYKDDNLQDDNVAVTVIKNGAVAVKAEGNKIAFTVPLHIYAKGRWMWAACKMCPTLQKTEDTEFDLVIKSESQLSFSDDYKVKTVTVGDFEWGNTKPVLTVGPLQIGLARFVEPAMRNQMSTLTAKLDKEIQDRIKIKDYIQEAWVQMQQPIPLDKDLDAWLTVTPKDIKVSPLVARNGELHLNIGFTSYLQTITNGKPKIKINKNLPKLITDNRLSNVVQIGLVSEISYDHATKLLKEQVAGQKFTFEDGKDVITVNDIKLSGSGDKVVLMLDVTGKTKAGMFTKNIAGKVFLKAVPYYDVASTSIRVRDLDYDLDTKDQLLKTASWLAKNRFVESIQNQISFPVKSQLEDAHKMLQKTLDESGRVHESVLLKGRITEIVPDAIYLTPTAIRAVVNAKGNLTAQIDKL
ncbi:DUF4403 family protein [Adhaeribacter aquaticus]|uniref:DUF4403 family protein n=1 Tax=Adhaeribacter aquaticus TaxID=299567 RepID=UPI00047C4437|nr:DUF4403 family protein [Adhaeribacter aquaticus]